MLKKIKIDKVNTKDTDSKGVPFRWEQVKVGIKTANSEDWLNGFVKKAVAETLTVGSEVELEIWKDEKWGWQFKVPGKIDHLETRMVALEKDVAFIKSVMKGKQETAPEPFTSGQEVNLEDIPW